MLYVILIIILLIYFFLSANNGIAFEINRKSQNLEHLPSKYIIPFKLITITNHKDLLPQLNYPIIFKPNRCSGGGLDVQKINNQEEADHYLQKYLKCGYPVMAQEYDRSPREFTVLYEKHPLLKRGSVIAITERVPVKKSNGFKTYNLGYSERKCNVVDHTNKCTKKFEKLIDKITQQVPDLNVGRYDIKADSLEDLLNSNFKIIELNGLLGSEQRSYMHTMKDIHYLNASLQLRWFLKRCIIGIESNLVRGPIMIIKNLYSDRITLCKSDIDKVKDLIMFNLFNKT